MVSKTAVFCLIAIMSSAFFLSACGGDDSEDRAQQQNAQDALRDLDLENQKNRAGQTIPNQPPQITILAPVTGSIITSSPVEVSWSATDQNGDKLGAEIQYRSIGDAPGQYKPVMPLAIPDPKKYSFDVATLPPGDYELMVKVSDGTLSNVAFTRIKKQ